MDIPIEIVFLILQNLSVYDLFNNCVFVHRSWHNIINNKIMYKFLYRRICIEELNMVELNGKAIANKKKPKQICFTLYAAEKFDNELKNKRYLCLKSANCSPEHRINIIFYKCYLSPTVKLWFKNKMCQNCYNIEQKGTYWTYMNTRTFNFYNTKNSTLKFLNFPEVELKNRNAI